MNSLTPPLGNPAIPSPVASRARCSRFNAGVLAVHRCQLPALARH